MEENPSQSNQNQPYFVERFFTKDKYRLIQHKEDHSPAASNEIYVTNEGRPNKFFAYGAEYLLKNPDKNIRIKATGKAISKAFLAAELIRHRVKGLHQQTHVDTTDSITRYEPLEEGLDVVSIAKKLSVVEITLSFQALDVNHYGYQEPLDEKEVKEITLEDLMKKKQQHGKPFEKKFDQADKEKQGPKGQAPHHRRAKRGGGGHRYRPRSLSASHQQKYEERPRRGGGGFRRGRGGGRRGGFQRPVEEKEREEEHRGDRGEHEFTQRRRGNWRSRGSFRGRGGARDEREGGERNFVKRGGYDRGGNDRGGFERGGYERGGYERGGFERGGSERGGFERGFDRGRAQRGGRGSRNRHFESKDDLYKVKKKGWNKGKQQQGYGGPVRKISGKGDKAWYNNFSKEDEKKE